MTTDIGQKYPIQDADALRTLAGKVHRMWQGTDDAPVFAARELEKYPPLYAAAAAVMLYAARLDAANRQEPERLARFLLAVAQDRIKPTFDTTAKPYGPEWL